MVRLAQLRLSGLSETSAEGVSPHDGLRSSGLTLAVQGIDQTQQLVKIIEKTPNFRIVTPPSLSLVVVRLVPPAKPDLLDAELDLLNQRLHTRLNARSDIFLTPTVLHSVEREFYCIRIAAGSHLTTMKDVEETWAVVVEEGEKVLSDWVREQEQSLDG